MLIKHDRQIILGLNIFLILLLPGLINTVTDYSSLAPGLVIASVLLLALNLLLGARLRANHIFFIIGIFCLILISSGISYVIYDTLRPLFSSVLIICFVWVLSFLYLYQTCSMKQVMDAVRMSVVALLFIGWINFFNLFFYGRQLLVFFGEASHYALTAAILFPPMVMLSSHKVALFLILSSLLFAVAFPSLTFLVVAGMCSFLYLCRFKFNVIVSFMFVIAGLWIVYLYLPDANEYFISRVNLEGSNLSLLVYIQGFYLAWYNLVGTFGLGLGYQMLGEAGTVLPEISYLIASIKYDEVFSSISSGGFVAAKLVAEFGVIGCLLVIVFLIKWMSNLSRLISIIRLVGKENMHTNNEVFLKEVITRSIVFGSFIEIFFRGTGYFSGTLLLMLASLIYLADKNKLIP